MYPILANFQVITRKLSIIQQKAQNSYHFKAMSKPLPYFKTLFLHFSELAISLGIIAKVCSSSALPLSSIAS